MAKPERTRQTATLILAIALQGAVAADVAASPSSRSIPGSHAPVEMILPDRPGPHPVVVIAHGAYVTKENHRTLALRLAEDGFAVALFRAKNRFSPRQKAWIHDLRATVDDVAVAASQGGDLQGQLDLDRIGLVGHSLSGVAVMGAAASDPRIKAVVALAPGSPFTLKLRRFARSLRTPTLVLAGTHDLMTPASVFARPAARANPKYVRYREVRGGHAGFVDPAWAPRFVRHLFGPRLQQVEDNEHVARFFKKLRASPRARRPPRAHARPRR